MDASKILNKEKKVPTGQFARSGGWGDDVILIVKGPNAGFSGFGMIGNHYKMKLVADTYMRVAVSIATIWPNQEPIEYTNNGIPMSNPFAAVPGHYHEEPGENCQIIKCSKDWFQTVSST
jgi:hypothetical protein